jgi:hypothetical protein
MPNILLKLVGYGPSMSNDYIIEITENVFTLNNIIDNLRQNGFTAPVNDIRFIFKGNTIIDENKEYELEGNDIIYLFSTKNDIKQELIKTIFKSNNVPIKEEPLPDVDEELLTQDKIKFANQNVIEMFKDPDFVTMLKICLTKPNIVNMVTNYLNSGDISIEIKDYEEFIYIEELNQINMYLKELNIIIDDNIIKNTLMSFNGHLNLSLRYLLSSL